MDVGRCGPVLNSIGILSCVTGRRGPERCALGLARRSQGNLTNERKRALNTYYIQLTNGAWSLLPPVSQQSLPFHSLKLMPVMQDERLPVFYESLLTKLLAHDPL